MTDFRPRRPRQPILNLPPMTTALLIANVVVAAALLTVAAALVNLCEG